MRPSIIIAFIYTSIFTISCGNSPGSTSAKYTPPAPGTLIAADSVQQAQDTLNSFYFSVALVAGMYPNKGVYDLSASLGPNKTLAQFTMPKGMETYQVALRRGAEANVFKVGFFMPDDTTFYEYYEVRALRKSIVSKYLKAYSLQ